MKRFTCWLFLWLLSLSVWDCDANGNGYFIYADFWCAINSNEPTQVEYLVDWYFNEELTMQYRSTVGNWTGFTPAGVITASHFNANKYDLDQRKLERQLICVNNVGSVLSITEKNTAEPSVTLVETTSSHHDTMLVCSAYDFYPKHIKVTWHRNGREVTSGVTVSEVMTNGDWTYQVHSYLEYMPGDKDKISCMVEHFSLREPKIYEWDASLNQSERSYLIGGICVLLLGTVCLSLGLIQYRRKSCDARLPRAS